MSKDVRHGQRENAAPEIDEAEIWKEFQAAVNMSAGELDAWLKTEDSRAVGWTHEGEHESVGHHEGRRIVEIKHKRHNELGPDDYAHMRKVVGYVHRHLAQGGPAANVETSRWRYSLKNWGHDPLKDR